MFSSGLSRAFATWYTEPQSPARAVIHSIKYGYSPALAAWAGGLSMARIPDRLALDALVPMPLHRLRRVERGFNQAEQIASGVSARASLPILGALERVQHGRSQTSLSAVSRRALATGTFSAAVPVDGMRLLLVDDVITTGSTMNAAARCLLEAGAERVFGLALAVSRRPGSP